MFPQIQIPEGFMCLIIVNFIYKSNKFWGFHYILYYHKLNFIKATDLWVLWVPLAQQESVGPGSPEAFPPCEDILGVTLILSNILKHKRKAQGGYSLIWSTPLSYILKTLDFIFAPKLYLNLIIFNCLAGLERQKKGIYTPAHLGSSLFSLHSVY